MAIMIDFQFSQASLQDFIDCKRRFYYRYIQKLAWPALEAEPALSNEVWMQEGVEFHQIVNRYLLGIPVEKISRMVSGENVDIWWKNFLEANPVDLSNHIFTEKLLISKVGEYSLSAKFDLVLVDEENTLKIYDWKTSRHLLSREKLSTRMQTKVYPFVLANEAASLLQGQKIQAEKIKMIYWYANHPSSPILFHYSSSQKQKDQEILLSLIEEIISMDGIEDYSLTNNRNTCRYCVYRSLCDRGVKAGLLEDFKGELSEGYELALDFDQIPEIEF